jgi:hypothetical protein
MYRNSVYGVTLLLPIERGRRKKRIANSLMPIEMNASYAGYEEEAILAMQTT